MMRNFPLYDGDGFIRSPAGPAASLLVDAGKPAFAGPFVDFVEIEKQAWRTRAEALGGMLARLFDRIEASVHRANYHELEKYLGESTDLADLERRLRHIGVERHGVFARW